MKLAASLISLSILLTAPGLAPYEAAAQGFRSSGSALPTVNVSVKTGSLPGVNVSNLPSIDIKGAPSVSVPKLPGVIQPGAVAPSILPAVNVNVPAAVLPQAAELVQQIQAAKSEGEKQDAVERFYERRLENKDGEAPSAPDESAVPSDASGASTPAKLDASAPKQPAAKAKVPVSPDTNPELFAARSSRVGIGPLKYVYWNVFYDFMQWLNVKLARDPNRKVSWDKWPTKLGLVYLIAKIRFLRSGTITDPYDYASKDIKPAGREPEQAKKGYTADGRWVSDRERPEMGAKDTRFGSNIPPKKVRPDVENMEPSAREAAKLRWRNIDESTGKPIVNRAGILNNLAGGWIQFNFHNFGGNTKRDPIDQNPHKLPRTEKDGWAEKEALVDRTSKDQTRVTDNGRPTPLNERTQAWIHAQIYGTSEEEQAPLRSYVDGKMRLDENGNLPADPKKPGIDLTGFANNYNPLLSFLHWAFVVNHNDLAEHYKYFNPTWTDEEIFTQARKANVAIINTIHTVEWTEDLLQHPTLQEGMHAEFYGLFGPKVKAWLMRFSYRHPWFAKLIKPISNNDVIWGMPGSKWEHHDGPFQVPKHFRMVYRLHEMILDEQEFLEPGTDRRLDRVQLIDFVHGNTRPIVEKFGYDVLAYSFARKSAGALTLHNFPRALSQFRNQQNGQLTDLAELDLFRERTDGTGTYNEFRRSVGEAPVTSFLELTGGDAALAKEIEIKYQGDIDAVDAGIGILAEPKPAGFALGFTQFYQFVLNAPRRVKSNRHLTEYFTHKDYTFEGMEYVLHSGGMGGVIARAMRKLPNGQAVIDSMEGVTRWFAPWQDTETFPVRQMDSARAHSGKILKANLITLGLGIATAVAGVSAGIASPLLAAFFPLVLAPSILLYAKRMLAWRFMQKTWQSVYTDRRRSMFPTLFKGERWTSRAVSWGRFLGKTALLLSLLLAWTLMPTDPWVAGLFIATALSTLSSKKATAAWENDMRVLKIALQNRMRQGYPVTQISEVEGGSAIERRYSFLIPPGATAKVANFGHTFRALHEHGLGRLHAFKTALISHLIFGPRTQRGLGLKGRWKAGILFKPFAIYVPNMVQAKGPSSMRIYDKAGNVDEAEFDRMFRTWAPGRDYLTAYDFSRMREGNRYRSAAEGVGTPFSRFVGELAVKYRTDQLLQLYADRVANEDKKLVPAISRDMLMRVYQGTAQNDIALERALDGVHPDLKAPTPVDPEAAPKKTFVQRLKSMGWKGAALFLAFYAVKGLITLAILKWLLS